MKIADACDWLQLEQAQEPADMLVCLRGDLLAEIDQERLIAGALKSRGLGSRWEHARILYCVTPARLRLTLRDVQTTIRQPGGGL